LAKCGSGRRHGRRGATVLLRSRVPGNCRGKT
jgi:hypothetical protein